MHIYNQDSSWNWCTSLCIQAQDKHIRFQTENHAEQVESTSTTWQTDRHISDSNSKMRRVTKYRVRVQVPSHVAWVWVRVTSHEGRVRVRVTSHHALEIHFSVLKFHCVDTYLLFLTATCTCTEIQRVGNKEVLKAISVTCMVVRYFQKSALKKEHPHWKSTFRPLTSCWQQNTLHYTSHQHWSKCLLQENVSSMDSNDHVVLFSKPVQVHVFQNCFTL